MVSDSENPKNAAAGVFPPPLELLTVSVNDRVAVCCGDEESFTGTVKVNAPVCVVVPERIPPELRLNPLGSEPEDTVQLYGVLPPVALIVLEYAVPAVAAGTPTVVMLSALVEFAVIVTEAAPDFVGSAWLVAVTVADVFTLTVGA